MQMSEESSCQTSASLSRGGVSAQGQSRLDPHDRARSAAGLRAGFSRQGVVAWHHRWAPFMAQSGARIACTIFTARQQRTGKSNNGCVGLMAMGTRGLLEDTSKSENARSDDGLGGRVKYSLSGGAVPLSWHNLPFRFSASTLWERKNEASGSNCAVSCAAYLCRMRPSPPPMGAVRRSMAGSFRPTNCPAPFPAIRTAPGIDDCGEDRLPGTLASS
ncbi:hypothetical protein VTK56DRAFT_3167 [Thermocarpiscus australiensis]